MPRPSHNAYAYAFGDVIELPAAAKSAGGGALRSDRQEKRDIAHHVTVNSR